MWDEDTSAAFEPEDFDAQQGQRAEEGAEEGIEERAASLPGQLFPGVLIPSPFGGVMPPNVVARMDLYEAARALAVADQQLSKLFNPEYYI